MIKAVLFDLDGTLTDTLSTIAHFGNCALGKFGFPPIPTERYRYLVGDGRDLLIHRMLAEHGADTAENYQNVGAAYDAAYEADVLHGTVPYDGIPELLTNLQENGLKTAVLSNKPHNVTKMVVQAVFGNRFDIVYGQRPGYPMKPDPAVARMVAEELGVSPAECAFVGDTSVDIATGKNAGMLPIGVLWGFRDAAELRRAGAAHIVKKPQELLQILADKRK